MDLARCRRVLFAIRYEDRFVRPTV
jgi:hypothetical protein